MAGLVLPMPSSIAMFFHRTINALALKAKRPALLGACTLAGHLAVPGAAILPLHVLLPVMVQLGARHGWIVAAQALVKPAGAFRPHRQRLHLELRAARTSGLLAGQPHYTLWAARHLEMPPLLHNASKASVGALHPHQLR